MKRTNVVILGVGALFFMVAEFRLSGGHKAGVAGGPEGVKTHYRVGPARTSAKEILLTKMKTAIKCSSRQRESLF